MEHPEIAKLLLEAASSITVYENTLKDIEQAEKELEENRYPLTRPTLKGKIEMLQGRAVIRLQEYHNAMDTVFSLHSSILAP